jgi:hypothetical protein
VLAKVITVALGTYITVTLGIQKFHLAMGWFANRRLPAKCTIKKLPAFLLCSKRSQESI